MSAGNTGSAKEFMNSFTGARRASVASSAAADDKPRSPSSPVKYAGLMAHKRGSMDEAAKARRASWDEQRPAAGMVGGWWNKMMRG